MVYTLQFFSIQNAVRFILLTYLVPVLLTFYIQVVLNLKKNSGVKRLRMNTRAEGHVYLDTVPSDTHSRKENHCSDY